MDNLRLFLWLTFFAMLWLTYSTWVADYSTAASVTAPPPAQTASTPSPPEDLPDLSGAQVPSGGGDVQPPSVATSAPSAPVHVRTDVLDVVIDLHGGDLVRADLPTYPVDKHKPDVVVRLLDYAPENRWLFQTGLRSAAGGDEPNHLATYRSASNDYVLAPGQDELVVALDWVNNGALMARKVYTFRRGSFAIDLDLSLTNTTGSPWRGAAYAQMARVHRPPERSYTSVDSYSFTGPVLYDGDQYEKLDFGDLSDAPVSQTLMNGWLAAIQHHFLAAAVPPPTDEVRYQASARGQEFVLSALGMVQDVAPGAMFDYRVKLFVGPKLQEQLKATAEGLDRAVDYGVFTVLAQPLFWVLAKIDLWVGNWGLAIIIFTFLIKLAFYKLTETSGRSMAKMRKLAPRMKALQERFKDDRQALSQAMMDLYKREKVNPAAGCLPILIQMPFFLAFYWVLVESVEMRQAPFMLWIDDLSARDPYFVLPLLMGAAMFFQTHLNPAPPDPVQARVMQIMPLIFTVFFAFFPSGLVLYWLTNTALSILQQWRINKVVAQEAT
jgi:YidC/Oxa1 family membrane protein insertase